VAKLADATDLKSVFPQGECGFNSRPGHHFCKKVVDTDDRLFHLKGADARRQRKATSVLAQPLIMALRDSFDNPIEAIPGCTGYR
jgi:hypothetical protein